jgi:DNA-binding LacI/PurR family transcriptional regulator
MTDRATLKDVAREAGVSQATVSYVMNGKKTISAETADRVQKAVEKLNYVPDLSARSLSSHDSRLIGVVIPQTEPGSKLMLQNAFYSEILSSIEYHARLAGYHILISATDVNETYLTLAKERNLDGIIVIGMYPDEFYQQMKKTQIPIVLVDSYCNDHYYHSVRIDDAYGSYLATKYVLDCGHTDVAFFSGMLKENGVMKKRLTGYRQALEERKIPFRSSYVFEGSITYESGMILAKKLAASRCSASVVVAAADILAMGAIKGFYEMGIRVPDQISVMGFDDVETSQYLTPGLSTIKQDISLKGEKAVELLMNSIRQPNLTKQEQILPLQLIERNSVKKISIEKGGK